MSSKAAAAALEDTAWATRLVNEANPLPENFSIKTVMIEGYENRPFDARAADALEAMLAEHNFHPHRALRKGANTIYIKAADHIEDLLTFMGAGGAAMRIMDQRMYNEMRNKTNRLSNCETANISKSVNAAVQVQLAIEKLQAAGALNTLPETLRHTARLRMQYPDLPLAKLAQKFDPPVSKAGLSHRMKKIQEAAARLDAAPEPTEKEATNA